MKRIRITEKKFGYEEKTLFDETFEKMLLVTDDHCGMIGIEDFDDIMLAIDSMLDNIDLKYTGYKSVPEEERSQELVEDAALVKTLIGFNLATMTLGPIADSVLSRKDDVAEKKRERYEEMLAIAKEVKALSFRVAALSDSFDVKDWRRDEGKSGDEETAS